MKLTLKGVLLAVLSACRDPKVAAAIIEVGGPIAGLILSFGLEPLGAVIEDLDVAEITEEMVRDALAKKGLRVQPIDISKLYGA